MNDNPWIEWNGGECPVDGNALVWVQFAAEEGFARENIALHEKPSRAHEWIWDLPPAAWDRIIAYRLSGPSA